MLKLGKFLLKGRIYDIYNENVLSIVNIFEMESLKTWNFLKNKYDFNFYYITTSPKTRDQGLNREEILKKNKFSIFLKNKQAKDILKILKEFQIEIIYTIPAVDHEDQYYFNFIIITKQIITFEALNSINFNLIKIVNVDFLDVSKISEEDISTLLYFDKEIFYDIVPKKSDKVGIKNKEQFKLLCMQIYSFDNVNNREVYDIDCLYGTNVSGKATAVVIYSEEKNGLSFFTDEVFISCIGENYDILKIHQVSFERLQ